MKKALLIGINNYPGQSCDLMGCLNDVENMQNLLTHFFGFSQYDIAVITDREATTFNILRALEMLVHKAQPGDLLVFHFSGHGSQVLDTSGDEKDKLDEILCPVDLDWSSNIIRDDDLAGIFGSLPAGVHLEVFLDCCHSGTGLRLVPNPTAALRSRFLPPPPELLPAGRKLGSNGCLRRLRPNKAQVLWAACRANQYAADALLDGRYGGAFTTFFCDRIRQAGGSIYRKDLLKGMRADLKKGGFIQVPQLETSRKLRRMPLLAVGNGK